MPDSILSYIKKKYLSFSVAGDAKISGVLDFMVCCKLATLANNRLFKGWLKTKIMAIKQQKNYKNQ